MKPITNNWLTERGLTEIRPGVYGRAPMLDKALVQSVPSGSLFGKDTGTNKVSPVQSPAKTPKSVTEAKIGQEDKFDFNTISIIHDFDILPCPAPRMTQSDRWKTNPNHQDENKRQRPGVTRYFAFKDRLRELCFVAGFDLPPVLNIMFIVPMPVSWSKTKQFNMNNTPHMSRPDRDNYLKAFQDMFDADDGYVWDGRTIKIWGYKGKILIF